MGGVVAGFPGMNMAQWKSLVDARASQHFNHLAVTLVDDGGAAVSKPLNSSAPRKRRSATQTNTASLSISRFSVAMV